MTSNGFGSTNAKGETYVVRWLDGLLSSIMTEKRGGGGAVGRVLHGKQEIQ